MSTIVGRHYLRVHEYRHTGTFLVWRNVYEVNGEHYDAPNEMCARLTECTAEEQEMAKGLPIVQQSYPIWTDQEVARRAAFEREQNEADESRYRALTTAKLDVSSLYGSIMVEAFGRRVLVDRAEFDHDPTSKEIADLLVARLKDEGVSSSVHETEHGIDLRLMGPEHPVTFTVVPNTASRVELHQRKAGR